MEKRKHFDLEDLKDIQYLLNYLEVDDMAINSDTEGDDNADDDLPVAINACTGLENQPISSNCFRNASINLEQDSSCTDLQHEPNPNTSNPNSSVNLVEKNNGEQKENSDESFSCNEDNE